MKINKPESENLSSQPLHQLFTQGILDVLKEGEDVSIQGEKGNFDFYKKGKNDFGIKFNSMGIEFTNNPMSTKEMQELLTPRISTAANFENAVSHDLLLRLKDMFFKTTKENAGKTFTLEDLFKNISLDNLLSTLAYKKELLQETEHKIAEGIVGYLENATSILHELILQYPENSVIKNKLVDKMKYMESYKKRFSDGKFIGGIEKDISDLETFLDILENQDNEIPLGEKIKELRTKKIEKNFSSEIHGIFNQIYAWDNFAIAASLSSDSAFFGSLDQGYKDFSTAYGLTTGSEEINRLGKKQEPLMDDSISFEQKKETFKNANQEYLDSIGLILGTGRNILPSTGGYYREIQEDISIDKFITMPCSDTYPAVLQKTILPFYLKDLYKEACGLLGSQSLDKTLDKYIDEFKNPSGFAKLASKFKSNENKIESLKQIGEKIRALSTKFNTLEKQIKNFGNKKTDDLIVLASEFSISEEFHKVNNIYAYAPFTMSDQDKWLDFMRNN